MKLEGSDILLNSEGKGLIGCIGAIILLAVLVFAGIKLGPIYYTNFIFEEDIKNVTSRAGARGLKNDIIIEDILELARRKDINLTKENASKNITIERYAGMVHIEVRYFVPVDFLVMEKNFEFEIKASSFSSF
jgi:hypothetical protein